jgi:peptidyl-prolyl cis-trans isomerase C
LALTVVTIGAGCERRAPISGESRSPVLATVNGKELTQREFERFLPEDYRDSLAPEEVRDYVDRWITTQLLYEEALKTGPQTTPDIDARIEQYRKDLVAEQLVEKIIEERAQVTDREIHEFYEAHRQEYEKEYRVSHILVNTPEEASAVHSLLGTRSFEELAQQYSVDKHSNVGGDLGYLSKGNMIPEFEGIIFNMKVADVSDVIPSEFGYHIIKVTDIRETSIAPDDVDVAEEITNILTLQKRQAVYDSLVAALKQRAKIDYALPTP